MQIFQKPTKSAKPLEAQWRNQTLRTIHQEAQPKSLGLPTVSVGMTLTNAEQQ